MKKTERGDATQFTCVSVLETLDTPPRVAFELLPGGNWRNQPCKDQREGWPRQRNNSKGPEEGFLDVFEGWREDQVF